MHHYGRQSPEGSARALELLERAIGLDPDYAQALGHAMLGAANVYAGNPEVAIQSVDHAIRLSPQDTFPDKFHLYYSLAHFQAGDYAESARAAERAIQLKPEHPNTHMPAASAYALAGEKDRAEAALAMFKQLVPGTNASNVQRAIAYKREEDRVRLADGLRQAGLEG